MASNDNTWVIDAVGDFIHSSIWAAPIHTFIEANCASFDYDEDEDEEDNENPEEEMGATSSPKASLEEQMKIHQQYQRLVDALISGLGQDLSLDANDLKQACEIPKSGHDSVMIDEPFEQLYSARDFELFQEMMRRKNLILQLQALVSLQLQWGLLKHSDAGDDLVLSLLLQATSAPARRDSVNPPAEPIEQQQQQQQQQRPRTPDEKHQQNDDDDDDDVVIVPQKKPSSPPSSRKKRESQPKKPAKKEYNLPNLRHKGGDVDTDWYRNLRQDSTERDDNDDDDVQENDQSKNKSTPQTIGAIPEGLLREKLRELTIRGKQVDDETAAAMESRKKFLLQQRDKIVEKQRVERAQDLEKETQQQPEQSRPGRPQSAAIARKVMVNTNKQEDEPQPQISDEEMMRRRAMAAKLKREVVNKR